MNPPRLFCLLRFGRSCRLSPSPVSSSPSPPPFAAVIASLGPRPVIAAADDDDERCRPNGLMTPHPYLLYYIHCYGGERETVLISERKGIGQSGKGESGKGTMQGRRRERKGTLLSQRNLPGKAGIFWGGLLFFSTVMGPVGEKERKKGEGNWGRRKSHSAWSHEKYRRKPPKHEFCVGENYPPAKKESPTCVLAASRQWSNEGSKGKRGGISRHLRHNSRRNHQNNHR